MQVISRLGREPGEVVPPGSIWLAEVGYWVLPKPADLGIVLFDALEANNLFAQLGEYRTLKQHGAFHPALSILSSLLFMGLLLALAGYEFVHTDY
jgi:hypothetical protein